MTRNRKSKAALLLALPALLCGALLVSGTPTQAEVTNPGATTIKIVGGTFTMNKADPDGDPPINFRFPDLVGPWACNDGIDNDLDGFTDTGSDPECAPPTGTYHATLSSPPTQADTNESMAGYQGVFECNDGIDQDLDVIFDHVSVNPTNPDSGGTNGCAYSTDPDEDSTLSQAYFIAPTFTGTTAADGTVSVTAATFQVNWITFDASALGVPPPGTIKAQITMLPEGFPWTGSMNPNYGAGDVSMDAVKLTIKISVPGGFGGSCRMGAIDGSNPIVIDNLTTGTSGSLTGAPAAPGSGVATVVRGDFGLNVTAQHENGVDSCPPLIMNGMNDFLNLPNASGNDATFALQATPTPLGYGAISGTITEDGSGTPLPGVWARVRNKATNTYVAKTLTDANGDFLVTGLPPGQYTVWYNDPDGSHASEYNGGGTVWANAPAINVAASATTDADASLAGGGTLTGTVTEVGSGNPLAGVNVRIRNAGTGAYVAATVTNGSGQWSKVLPAGSYKVLFEDGGVHTQEFSANKPGAVTATVIVLGSGATIVVDEDLALAI